MGTRTEIFDTVDVMAQYFAALLAEQILETPAGRRFSWVLSGGSTPATVFREIASSCRATIDWSRVNIFWGDERCVAPDDRESNYKMARESLLDHVPVPTSNIFRIHGEADPAAEAARYSDLFESHVKMHQGVPQADLIMLGLGEDGHTASIFPSNVELFNSDKLFEVAEHPETAQKRITATGRIINHAKLVVILATGESKAARVAQVINRIQGRDILPASLVSPENGQLLWLLDQKSAERLTSG
jgi:6-phosphogluconolactonase